MFPRWKAALAAVIAAILAWSGALALVGWYQPAQQADLAVQDQKAVQPVELPILMYHHIHKSASGEIMWCPLRPWRGISST